MSENTLLYSKSYLGGFPNSLLRLGPGVAEKGDADLIKMKKQKNKAKNSTRSQDSVTQYFRRVLSLVEWRTQCV